MRTTSLLLLAIFVSSVYTLQFNSSGYFTIVQFTDLHYGTSDEKDAHTTQLQKNILSWIKPDLVVISGDGVFTSDNVASGWFKSQWKKFTAPTVEAKIPYAFTLGNHDAEGDLTRRQIVRLDATSPYSIRNQSAGIPDTANFRVPVYASKNNSQLAAHLWVLDSGDYGCGDVNEGYGCIESDVVEWYDEESKKVKQEHGSNVHHLAYFHIPLPEYLNVYNNEEIYGHANEGVYCSVWNTGFFSRAKNNGDIQAMFVGHDHNNDFGGFYEGIELVYGRKSGYGLYGALHGARVVRLKENYDAEGNLYVTREHFVVDVSGVIEPPSPMKKRQGKIQLSCTSADGGATLFSHLQKVLLVCIVLLYLVF